MRAARLSGPFTFRSCLLLAGQPGEAALPSERHETFGFCSPEVALSSYLLQNKERGGEGGGKKRENRIGLTFREEKQEGKYAVQGLGRARCTPAGQAKRSQVEEAKPRLRLLKLV